MSDTLIKVEGLYKKFCRSLNRSMFYGTIDATKSMFGFPIENVDLIEEIYSGKIILYKTN